MIQMSFGKDEHGLREKDIDYKDKQNYNTVLNTSQLLHNIPDAKAKMQFVYIINPQHACARGL